MTSFMAKELEEETKGSKQLLKKKVYFWMAKLIAYIIEALVPLVLTIAANRSGEPWEEIMGAT